MSVEEIATLDLDVIDARAEAAAPGPWHSQSVGEVFTTKPWWRIAKTCLRPLPGRLGMDQERADGRFIAAARTDVPALVAELRACREEKESLRRERRFAFKQVDDLTVEVERLTAENARLIELVEGHA